MCRIPTRDLRSAEPFNAFFFTPAATTSSRARRTGRRAQPGDPLLDPPAARAPAGPARRAGGPARPAPADAAAGGTSARWASSTPCSGRTKPVRANLDALFALPSAAVTLQTAAGLVALRAGRRLLEAAGRPAGRGRAAGDRRAARHPRRRQPGRRGRRHVRPRRPAAAPPAGGDASASTGVARRRILAQAEDSLRLPLAPARRSRRRRPRHQGAPGQHHARPRTAGGPSSCARCSAWCPGPTPDPDTGPSSSSTSTSAAPSTPSPPTARSTATTSWSCGSAAVVGGDLPVEPDLSRWFPLWDLPVR